MKSRILVPTVLVLLTLLCTSIYYFSRTAPLIEVTLGDTTFKTWVADTAALRERGLSGKAGLDENQAMLFVFDHDDTHGFWMKDMHFDIDILWLDSTKRVVHIERNVNPDSYRLVPPVVYTSPVPARYVLEIQAHMADKLGIGVGSIASW